MSVVAKKTGKHRRVIDFHGLNKSMARQTHSLESPFIEAIRVPAGTWKTTVDALEGYHSVPLRECDRHYTPFITPWGRYRNSVAPQGSLVSGDAYTDNMT